MESTIACKIAFKDLCSLFEKISNSARQKKGEYMKKYISYFRDYAKKMKQQSPLLVSTIFTEF
jgi:RNase P subunit RPR2